MLKIVQLQLLKYQSEAEEIVLGTSYDIYDQDGEYRLVDSSIGEVSKIRLPYVQDTVKLNRLRLNHLIESLSDWTENECLQAQRDLTAGTDFDLAIKEGTPKRYSHSL